MSQMTQFLVSHGGLFLFLIALADQSGLPLPAVPWLLAAGALAVGGKLSLLGAICWASLGSLGADMVWFTSDSAGKHVSLVYSLIGRLGSTHFLESCTLG